MTRYLTTLRLFWSTSVSAEMEYRANFVLAAVQSAGTLAGSLFVLWSLFRTGYELGGWTWHQALLVTAAYTVLDGFQATVLAPNREQIGELVREGGLDFVLLKPIDSQFWLSTRKLRIWGLPNLLLGAGLAVYAVAQVWPEAGGAGSLLGGLLRFALPMSLGLVMVYALGYLFSTLIIWFVKLNNITFAMQALLEAGRYPVSAYPGAYRVFFTFVLPVAFMTTVPAQWVLGRIGVGSLAVALGVAVALLFLSRFFWFFALRHYTSASS